MCELGNMYVDSEEVELARLVLARATGTPEPELYTDESPELYYQDDEALNAVIELQERMAKGLLMIEECSTQLQTFKDGAYVSRDTFMKWVNRRKRLWAHWFKLKAECQTHALADPSMWPRYFKLRDEDISPYFTTSDSEAIDNQLDLYDPSNTVRMYRDTHLEEQAKA
jgi:hypothetical protein